MKPIKIIADSSCELTLDTAKKRDITIVPFSVTFDGSKYYRENIDITIEEFYHTLRTQNVFPKTSLPSISAYQAEFRAAINGGFDVLCICITSKFSGSYGSAVNAQALVKEEFPDANIIVIDSQLCTAAQGAFVLQAADMRDSGMPIYDIDSRLELIKSECQIFVTVDSLAYLQKGGRIGKASALAGSLLSIKPIIVFKNGELNPGTKVRGRAKALAEIVRQLDEATGSDKSKYSYFVMHGDELETAKQTKEAIEKAGMVVDYPISSLGVTIGAHIGPTTIAIGYLRKHDTL